MIFYTPPSVQSNLEHGLAILQKFLSTQIIYIIKQYIILNHVSLNLLQCSTSYHSLIIYHLILAICGPVTSPHGRVEYNRTPINGLYPVNTTASHSCNIGYGFGGYRWVLLHVRTCQISANWDPDVEKCTRMNKLSHLTCIRKCHYMTNKKQLNKFKSLILRALYVTLVLQ